MGCRLFLLLQQLVHTGHRGVQVIAEMLFCDIDDFLSALLAMSRKKHEPGHTCAMATILRCNYLHFLQLQTKCTCVMVNALASRLRSMLLFRPVLLIDRVLVNIMIIKLRRT